eukprot:CAMPEP_0182559464 /NCGR_PEP_ID=MMETSP1324-20130603/2582_1 /TAXON_ID=236786 /ORGANISM="Florenciella sp., Strain RCC1587" /LENGTH=30 /DNA_ID= /DNA_START= /DNA_END= /DNA_ORIENTATION=
MAQGAYPPHSKGPSPQSRSARTTARHVTST